MDLCFIHRFNWLPKFVGEVTPPLHRPQAAWPLSTPDRYEAYAIKTALNKCIADLRRKEATYDPAAKITTASGLTSPFVDEAKPAQNGPKPVPGSTRTKREFSRDLDEEIPFQPIVTPSDL